MFYILVYNMNDIIPSTFILFKVLSLLPRVLLRVPLRVLLLLQTMLLLLLQLFVSTGRLARLVILPDLAHILARARVCAKPLLWSTKVVSNTIPSPCRE